MTVKRQKFEFLHTFEHHVVSADLVMKQVRIVAKELGAFWTKAGGPVVSI
ncbi:hypothetical protein [Thalassoroseus pseudoceratinae]|nr:hypothetical protein [Thalassoroseus pseudoceratinae]